MTKEIMLKGDKALLLAEAVKLNKEKNQCEDRISAIKVKMGVMTAGTYTNQAGDKLVISEIERYAEIDPKKVMDYLRKQKLVSQFPSTVKVQITPLKKLVPQATIAKWRKFVDSSLRWSFK